MSTPYSERRRRSFTVRTDGITLCPRASASSDT